MLGPSGCTIPLPPSTLSPQLNKRKVLKSGARLLLEERATSRLARRESGWTSRRALRQWMSMKSSCVARCTALHQPPFVASTHPSILLRCRARVALAEPLADALAWQSTRRFDVSFPAIFELCAEVCRSDLLSRAPAQVSCHWFQLLNRPLTFRLGDSILLENTAQRAPERTVDSTYLSFSTIRSYTPHSHYNGSCSAPFSSALAPLPRARCRHGPFARAQQDEDAQDCKHMQGDAMDGLLHGALLASSRRERRHLIACLCSLSVLILRISPAGKHQVEPVKISSSKSRVRPVSC